MKMIVYIISSMFVLSSSFKVNYDLNGRLFLYNANGVKPIPLYGYEVILYDYNSDEKLVTSITDSYGQFAFFSLDKGKYSLNIYYPGPYWKQEVWSQPIKVPGDLQPIVLDEVNLIKPMATYEKINNDPIRYRFTFWIVIPEEVKSSVDSVSYYFPHKSFLTPLIKSKNSKNNFKKSYLGWGCLSNVIITVNKGDEKFQIYFDMCKGLVDKNKK